MVLRLAERKPILAGGCCGWVLLAGSQSVLWASLALRSRRPLASLPKSKRHGPRPRGLLQRAGGTAGHRCRVPAAHAAVLALDELFLVMHQHVQQRNTASMA